MAKKSNNKEKNITTESVIENSLNAEKEITPTETLEDTEEAPQEPTEEKEEIKTSDGSTSLDTTKPVADIKHRIVKHWNGLQY